MNKLKFKRLSPTAKAPYKAYPGDAGFDLYANSFHQDEESGVITYNTGISVEIPEGYVGLLFPRSSVYKVGLHLANSVGVIDAGYRGEVKVKYYHKSSFTPYERWERVAQLVIIPLPFFLLEEVEELSSSKRGTGGFGSSGK